jgi:hypothetical protein
LIRFLNFINLLFIYYLGREDGGGNNDQESDGGNGREGNGEVGCEMNPIAIGKFLTFHFSFY